MHFASREFKFKLPIFLGRKDAVRETSFGERLPETVAFVGVIRTQGCGTPSRGIAGKDDRSSGRQNIIKHGLPLSRSGSDSKRLGFLTRCRIIRTKGGPGARVSSPIRAGSNVSYSVTLNLYTSISLNS